MRVVRVTSDQIAHRKATRPPGYFEDLAAALLRTYEDGSADYDADHAAFKSALKKYGPPPNAVPVVRRPPPRPRQAVTLARAMLAGKYVSKESRELRESICQGCDKLKIDPRGQVPYCGMCGCSVSKTTNRIRNLAAYEENLPLWGCKHPARSKGKGWPISTKG